VGGLSGSGKSRCARFLAPHVGPAPGALVLRTDVLRKRLAGVGLDDRLPADFYTPEHTRRTYDAMDQLVERVLSAGHGVIADAVFARAGERACVEGLAARVGVPFHGLWLEADPAVAAERLTTRTRNVSDATVAVLERQRAYDLGEITWTRIDSAGTREETDAKARAAVGVDRPAAEPPPRQDPTSR